MQAYIITETEKQNFLKELELEKLKSPNAMDVPLEMTPAEEKRLKQAVEQIHRRFHFMTCRLLS